MDEDNMEMFQRQDINDDIGEIWVNEFTEQSANKFRNQVIRASMKDPNSVIPVYIDSYGGNADSLAKMIETMDEVPNRFITICMGKAMSCGAILLSHGDIRFCGPYSRIMVHNVQAASWGDLNDMTHDLNESTRINKVFNGLLATNCGITYDILQTRIKAVGDSKTIYMGAEDALKFGIIDHIGVPDIIPVVQWSFNIPDPKERIDRTPPKQENPKGKINKKNSKTSSKK